MKANQFNPKDAVAVNHCIASVRVEAAYLQLANGVRNTSLDVGERYQSPAALTLAS